MKRFNEIDGLRTLAVLGVLWAHCWMFFGNPVLNLAGLPVNRILSFGGVGVDLFFVISGFCMYYTFMRKYPVINFHTFLDFIKNRWLRIAPVFYIAVIIYSFSNFFNGIVVSFNAIILHFLFVQTLFNQNHIASPFWSLATEWHFYVILPFLFLAGRKVGLYRTLAGLMIICLLLRFIQWGYILDSPLSIENYDRIYFRFIEFGWGILVCKWHMDNENVPKFYLGYAGFIVSFVIAFFGRLMNATEVILALKSYGFLMRALSEPIMTFGFALMVLNVVKSKSFFTKMLNSALFQSIGRVSYSFYLWHWIVSSFICFTLSARFGSNNYVLNIAFLFSAFLTYLVSILSYKLIEKKYFMKQKQQNIQLKLA